MIRTRRHRIPLQDARKLPLLTHIKYLAARDHVREWPPIVIDMSVNSRVFDKSMLKITYDS